MTEHERLSLQQKLDSSSDAFYKQLILLHPTLTTNEVKMCGLFKKGMKNKELSKLYGLSTKNYEQLRYRIKKKINLKRTNDLVKYLTNI